MPKFETAPHRTDSGMLYKVNQLAAAGICVYMLLPYLQRRMTLYGLIFFAVLWFVTTDIKWLTKPSKDMVLLGVFFTTFIPYAVTGKLAYGLNSVKVLTVILPIFFFGYFLNHYYLHYKKDYNTLGKIALVSLVCLIIASIQTYSGLLRYPNAARGLAGGLVVNNPGLVNLYRSLGIGGFGFVYAATIILICLIFILLKGGRDVDMKYRLLCLTALVVMSLMIIKASYALSILLIAISIPLIITVKRRSTLIIMVLGAVFLLLFPIQIIGEGLLQFANLFENNATLFKRFSLVAAIFLPDAGDAGNIVRIDLYLASVRTFLKHPLFGVYGPLGGDANPKSLQVIGHHSGWIDMLGFYGLFTGIPLFWSIREHMRKNLVFFRESRYYYLLLISGFVFVFMGVLNPNITVFEIGFAQFCVVPAMPFLNRAFVPNGHFESETSLLAQDRLYPLPETVM